jgi:hypothetical protein
MRLIKDNRGSLAVLMLAAIFILIILTMLISEYMRINALVDRVEAQLIQSANVSLEEAMIDSYRIDARGGVRAEDVRENLRVFFAQEIGLTAANQLLDGRGEAIYSLNNMQIVITEAPPRVEITCTLVIPSIPGLFSDFEIPVVVRSRNVRLR